MALNAYLTLKGQKSGQVKGSVTGRVHSGSISVMAVSHSIVSPRDPQSGLPSGQRMHKPFVFTKELDKSTPILYRMLATNENITECEFQFWTPSTKTSSGKLHYTVRLTNANIASIDFRMANARPQGSGKCGDCAESGETEEIAFTYQKIEWVYAEGGVTADDDWEARD